MQTPQIQIKSQFAQIQMQTSPSRQETQQPKAQLSIEQPKADLSITRNPSKLTIDQTQAWEDMGLMHVFRSNEKFAQDGRQGLLEGISRRTQQGDELMRIENGGNPLASQAKANGYDSMKQIGIKFIPSHNSVKLSYQPTEVQIDVKRNEPIIHVQPQKPIHNYETGTVEISMKLYAELEIDFVVESLERMINVKILTKYFDEMEIEEEKIITFPSGLPGFIDETRFILLELPGSPVFQVLQSIQNRGIAFVVTNPYHFYQDYSFDLDDHLLTSLEIKTEEDVMVLSIVTLKDPFSTSTINLKAPIIINHKKKYGKQYILNEDEYSIRTPIGNLVGIGGE